MTIRLAVPGDEVLEGDPLADSIADDLGPPSHNLTVRLHPVQVWMQQRLEYAPITLDDRGMRD